jgi:ABC-type sugar transport system substrate-binding protein
MRTPRTTRSRLNAIGVAGIAALAIGVAGCGSSSSSSSSSAAGATTASTAATSAAAGTSTGGGKNATQAALVSPVSQAQLQHFLDGVIEPGYDISKLPSYELQAWKVAAQPVTATEMAQLKKCLNAASCETGHGTLTIGYADGFGGNDVRKVYRALTDLQLLRYPQVKKIIYTDGGGDLTKSISNMRSLVAQKVNGIYGLFDFGAAMESTAKEAAAAGIPVVSESQNIPNATGHGDIAGDWDIDSCQQGTLSGQIAAKIKPGATVAIYTGTPGNPFGAKWIPCAQKAVTAGGGKIVTVGNTNWSPQGTAQAASALIAKGAPDAIIYDYDQTLFDQKFLQAGKTPPAAIGGSEPFSWYKLWLAQQGTAHAFPGYITQSQGGYYNVEIAELVEKALHQGSEYPLHGVLPTTVVSAKDLKPFYSPLLPGGTPFNSGLNPDLIKLALAAPTI